MQYDPKPSHQLDTRIDLDTDRCTFSPVWTQGMIEKVLQVGWGGQIGKIGKVVWFGLAFENW